MYVNPNVIGRDKTKDCHMTPGHSSPLSRPPGYFLVSLRVSSTSILECPSRVEQWKNLKEYFIIFLPRQKNFKREIECTIRYKRIAESLKSTLTPAHLAFVAFVSQDFESFLLTLQRKEPMIHILYTVMGSFLTKMLTKFVPAKVFMDKTGTPEQRMKSIEYLVSIDVPKEKNQRSLESIDIGSETKLFFYQGDVLEETKVKFRQECFSFYVTAVTLFQKKPLFNCTCDSRCAVLTSREKE